MALLKYSKPAKDCLPDPKGSLAGSVPSRIITSANLEVEQLLAEDKIEQKRRVICVVYYTFILVAISIRNFA